MKLNRLKDKNTRYQSHREFLSQSIDSKLIPKGLKLELEPTIGNHDQEFLDMWYSNLQELSRILVKGIVKFCESIVKQIPSYVKDTNDLINKINAVKSVPKNSYLVTMDVRSLYTNTNVSCKESIPNAEGMSAVKRTFDNTQRKLEPKLSKRSWH